LAIHFCWTAQKPKRRVSSKGQISRKKQKKIKTAIKLKKKKENNEIEAELDAHKGCFIKFVEKRRTQRGTKMKKKWGMTKF